jgi:uncharacterized membrane protein YhaH (DUF805 family)
MRTLARALLSIRGRLRRRQFWLGFFVIFVGGVYASQGQDTSNTLIGLLTLYMAFCLYGKRLHDFGRSAWPMLAPLGATFGAQAYAIAEISKARGYSFSNVREMVQLLETINLLLLGMWGVMTAWVGVCAGDRGDNRFGMDPREPHALPTGPRELA